MTESCHFIIEGSAQVPIDHRGFRCRAHRCSQNFTREHAEEAAAMAFGPGWISRVIEVDDTTKPKLRIYAKQAFDARIVQFGWGMPTA